MYPWQEISTSSLKIAYQASARFYMYTCIQRWSVCVWLVCHFEIQNRLYLAIWNTLIFCRACAKCLALSPIFSPSLWLNICEPPLTSINIQASLSGHLQGTSHSFKRITRVPFTQFEFQPNPFPRFLESLARVLSLWDFVCKDLLLILQIYYFPLALHALCVFAWSKMSPTKMKRAAWRVTNM